MLHRIMFCGGSFASNKKPKWRKKMETVTTNRRMRVQQAASKLGLTAGTLNMWRSQRKGPAYLKIGGRILYQEADLEVWIRSRQIDPEGTCK